MNEDTPHIKEVDEFILEQIDTVPHLEALLLLWNSRPKQWTVEEMASALYVSSGTARNILQVLARRGLLVAGRGTPENYRYESISSKQDSLIETVDATYRRNLVRISRMIHSKAAPGVREFAQAFRFTKDRE
jgi:predicted ArsR family transcriptional regulator